MLNKLLLSTFLLLHPLETSPLPTVNPLQILSHSVLYLGAGTAFNSLSLLARLGWGISSLSPWEIPLGKECLLICDLCGSVALHAFAQAFSILPSCNRSWDLNQSFLSQIPATSKEEKRLLSFLEKRWLAKSTGFYSAMVKWVSPCFGIPIQVHPETTNSYARDPSNKFSETYIKRVESWKKLLPHPYHYPLILTRPFDVHDYLTSYLAITQEESNDTILEKLTAKIQIPKATVIIDLTAVLPSSIDNREEWLRLFAPYETLFSHMCKERGLNPIQLLCIQRIQEEGIGGIRLLPLLSLSEKEIEQQHQLLLERISKFGLSANRIELDRCGCDLNTSFGEYAQLQLPSRSKEEYLSYLHAFDQNWKSKNPQKTLMVAGTLHLLEGLLSSLSEEKWKSVSCSDTQSSLTQLAFWRIQQQLEALIQEQDTSSFYDIAFHIEQIQADVTVLLEIFSPFVHSDFPSIYSSLLTSLPLSLKPLTSYGIHSTGMTTLAGILKAIEVNTGSPPHILYGKNMYFENIRAAELFGHATAVEEATEKEWKEADLFVAQFNPALRRIDFKITEYHVENVAEDLSKALSARDSKPLTLALDCTFDFLHSARVDALLSSFQKEIESGLLNVICYHSGLKFDLFGLDNYCGSPFYMIHNQDPKWNSFDALLTDPVLQTDPLSLNWFCLAYRYAASQLELYRKQIFDNTRSLLHKVPTHLLGTTPLNYRIVPMQEDADVCFIDIKIFGSLHELRADLLGSFLIIKCMEKKHPTFQRPSVGFYHPNLSILFSENCSTIRLTLGLDPSQVDLFARCFETIDTFNPHD